MEGRTDILVLGTGAFAARIALDIAATAARPVRLCIAGRNAARLAWLRTAAAARAAIFGGAAEVSGESVDLAEPEAAAALMARLRPAVVVQAASVQASAVIAAEGDKWSRLVAEGGLSATAVFQGFLSLRAAQALQTAGVRALFVNACFPDVVNGLLQAAGHPVACGVGNIGILSGAFAGATGLRAPGALRVLAHYQTIGVFRLPPEARRGPPPPPLPRVWIEGREVADVLARFRDVQLTREPAIEISGAAGVPLLLAMAAGTAWRGHAPGPNGMPGGYPVRFDGRAIVPDLPEGLSLDEAVRWNRGFEEANGLTVGADGRVAYHGALRERLRALSPALATGWNVADLEAVHADMAALRARLQGAA